MTASAGLLYKRYQRMGLDELQWLQYQNIEDARRLRLAQMRSFGLGGVRQPGGILGDTWRVVDEDNDGSVSVLFGSEHTGRPSFGWFVDSEGYTVLIDATDAEALLVPDDNTWRTLVVRRVASEYEPGTITVTSGSATITGSGTVFTRYSGKTSSGFGRGTRLYLRAPSLNPGVYEIDSIASDTSMTLVAAIVGTNEAGVAFSIAGDFATSPPANRCIHQFDTYEFELVTRTITPSNADIILADVKRDSGETTQVQILDRRHANLYIEARTDHSRDVLIEPLMRGATGSPFSPSQPSVVTAYNATNALHVHSAPCRLSQDILMVIQDSTTQIVSRHLGPDGVAASTVVIDNAGTATDPGVVRLPLTVFETTDTPAYPSHLCCYVKAQKLYYRTSPSDGSSWSAETLIMDPTAIDASDTIEHPVPILLRSGRLLVVLGYYSDADTQWSVRYIFSDDYGTTWDTNTNAGYVAYLSPLGTNDARAPSCRQLPDGRIFVVCQEGDNGGGDEFATWWIGASENDPSVVGDEYYWASLPDTSYVLTDPEIYVTPDDGICIIGTAWANPGALYVACLVVGTLQEIGIASGIALNKGIVTYTQPIVVTATPVAYDDLVPHLTIGRGGMWLLFRDSAGGTPDLLGMRCGVRSLDVIVPPQI